VADFLVIASKIKKIKCEEVSKIKNQT